MAIVRHSSMKPKQQRRPLPFLLSDFSSMPVSYRPIMFEGHLFVDDKVLFVEGIGVVVAHR